jgi:hypothetical protein
MIYLRAYSLIIKEKAAKVAKVAKAAKSNCHIVKTRQEQIISISLYESPPLEFVEPSLKLIAKALATNFGGHCLSIPDSYSHNLLLITQMLQQHWVVVLQTEHGLLALHECCH